MEWEKTKEGKEWHKNYRHEYYLKKEKDRDRKCKTCGKKLPLTLPRKYRRLGKLCWECYKEKRREYFKERARKNKLIIKFVRILKKQAIIGYYSNYTFECACCKLCDTEESLPFLSIDHINGGGSKQAKEQKTRAYLYDWLIRNNMPKGFQVYCHNCNMAKKINNGICPHKQE